MNSKCSGSPTSSILYTALTPDYIPLHDYTCILPGGCYEATGNHSWCLLPKTHQHYAAAQDYSQMSLIRGTSDMCIPNTYIYRGSKFFTQCQLHAAVHIFQTANSRNSLRNYNSICVDEVGFRKSDCLSLAWSNKQLAMYCEPVCSEAIQHYIYQTVCMCEFLV